MLARTGKLPGLFNSFRSRKGLRMNTVHPETLGLLDAEIQKL